MDRLLKCTRNPPFSKLSLIAKSTTNNGATLLNSPYSEELNKALNLELSGEYKQAMSIYKEIFEQELNTDIGRYCMVKINDCYVALKRTDFDEYVGNILSDKFENTDLAALRIELRNRGLMREEKFDKVLDNLTMLSSNENFSEVIRKNNMYNTALLYLNCYNNYSKAHELFTEFKSNIRMIDYVLMLIY